MIHLLGFQSHMVPTGNVLATSGSEGNDYIVTLVLGHLDILSFLIVSI